jgi:hypothetical protein
LPSIPTKRNSDTWCVPPKNLNRRQTYFGWSGKNMNAPNVCTVPSTDGRIASKILNPLGGRLTVVAQASLPASSEASSLALQFPTQLYFKEEKVEKPTQVLDLALINPIYPLTAGSNFSSVKWSSAKTHKSQTSLLCDARSHKSHIKSLNVNRFFCVTSSHQRRNASNSKNGQNKKSLNVTDPEAERVTSYGLTKGSNFYSVLSLVAVCKDPSVLVAVHGTPDFLKNFEIFDFRFQNFSRVGAAGRRLTSISSPGGEDKDEGGLSPRQSLIQIHNVLDHLSPLTQCSALSPRPSVLTLAPLQLAIILLPCSRFYSGTIIMKTLSFIALLGTALFATPAMFAAEPVLPNPILFVTQTPQPNDFTTVTSHFGNHRGDMESAPRGGALWIRYEDGTLRNLTRAAGYGLDTLQHTNGIAVREPSIYWDGKKAIFSMVVGAPIKQYDYKSYYWQLYELSNFASNQIPVITKVSNQPTNYNNVSPIYGTDDRIIFTSDRPRDGQRHLYPQIDEYEEAPVVTGLWSLNPSSGDLFMLNHAPSGAFSPSIDSFGRVIFSRWDHLQRDQQADADNSQGSDSYGTFNYTDESSTALILTNNRTEIFPEARYSVGITNGHTFNQFFPWQINQDGTGEETVNHIGRHELGGSYRSTSFSNDPNIRELYDFSSKPNTNIIENFLQLRESPTQPGLIFAIDAPEFSTHAAGQIVSLDGAPSINPDLMKLHYLTPRSTASYTDGNPPPADHTGLYRNPLPLSDGRLVSVHTPETRYDHNDGTASAPKSRYDFRLKLLKLQNGYWQPDLPLTPGISANLTWWQPDYSVTYNGLMWELDPVEVRARTRPTPQVEDLPPIEQQVFQDEGVNPSTFQNYLRQRDLALFVTRNVTGRDDADQQQPFNLRVPGGVQSAPKAGKIYDIAFLQLFQADLIRGIGMRPGATKPNSGRRVLPQQMHEPLADNLPTPASPGVPVSSVPISLDGSVAALVPARRAISWQTTDAVGTPVVRERYWITFQPGEIRSCANCHGVNQKDQLGHAPAANAPEALRQLLRQWKTNNATVVSTTTIGASTYSTITFKRQTAATALKQKIEYSLDLSTWFPASEYTSTGATHYGPLIEINRSPGAIETITLRETTATKDQPTRFYRVRSER